MFTENITLILCCLGVVQALLLCAYLFSLRDKNANLFLALTLAGQIIIIGKYVLNNYVGLASWIRILGISGNLITGPFLWFYGKALFEKKVFSSQDYLHLVPFALFILLCGVIPNGNDFTSYFIASLVFLHLAAYLAVCWFYILKKLKGSRLLPWYRNIVSGVTLVWFLYIGIFTGLIPVYIFGAVIFSFLIYLFSYLLLKRHVFILEKYGNSPINQITSRQLLEQIKEMFETKEIYLDSTVSLKFVAQKLSTTPHAVSQVINENAEMNFNEFVNHYRIARAKNLLADPSNLREKIETIAYDCGFGNVTSFNLAFKAATGMTPSQYRNKSGIG